MTDRAHDAAERLAAARHTQPGGPPKPRAKPIRSSLDLPPHRHYALRDRENELIRQYAAVRGLRQALLSAMVAVYLTDEAFARRVDAQLANDLRHT
jgi:hypothetical protein